MKCQKEKGAGSQTDGLLLNLAGKHQCVAPPHPAYLSPHTHTAGGLPLVGVEPRGKALATPTKNTLT